jgi:hypothetical protein
MNKHFGYLEGFYGRLLSWQERHFLLSSLRKGGLNTYLYAPKEDTLHRQQWRTPYPADWMRQFSEFVQAGHRKKIAVVPGLAPGLSFDFDSAADYRRLLQKFQRFADNGVGTVALLMDDIPLQSSQQTPQAVTSQGAAQGRLAGRLRADLQKRFAGLSLWFCPTVYSDQMAEAGHTLSTSPYLRDLRENLPAGIPLLWTGPGIISAELSARSLAAICRMFDDNVIIWDNLYANDYCPSKLFIGPYTGRSTAILKTTAGVLLNPTGLPLTDAFLLTLLAGFTKKYDPRAAWQAAAAEHGLPQNLPPVLPYVSNPFPDARVLRPSPRKLDTHIQTLQELIFDWKGPLHREWYPYLYQAQMDLRLLRSVKSGLDAAWVKRKFPPVLASLLVDR